MFYRADTLRERLFVEAFPEEVALRFVLAAALRTVLLATVLLATFLFFVAVALLATGFLFVAVVFRATFLFFVAVALLVADFFLAIACLLLGAEELDDLLNMAIVYSPYQLGVSSIRNSFATFPLSANHATEVLFYNCLIKLNIHVLN
ncbi:MAG: hypothetical protein OXF02_06900 [Simkaniaceae bacterium]|nr:hypothetical protein [Simkaniaceae bacterium]